MTTLSSRVRRALRVTAELIIPSSNFNDYSGPTHAGTCSGAIDALTAANGLAQDVTQTVTDDPRLLQAVLTDRQLNAAMAHPWLHRPLLGTAIQNAVTSRIPSDPVLAGTVPPADPIRDPRGRPDHELADAPKLFADLTTVLGVDAHFGRPNGDRLALVLHDYRRRLDNRSLHGLVKEAFEERFGIPAVLSPRASETSREVETHDPVASEASKDQRSEDLRVVIPSSVGRPRSAPPSTAYERARMSLGRAPFFDPDRDGWPRSAERIELDSAVTRADDVSADEAPATSRPTARANRASAPGPDLGLEIGF